MNETIVLEFCGEPLALTREQFDEATFRGRELRPPAPVSTAQPSDQVVDSATLAAMLSVRKSWIEAQARYGTLPCLRLGRYRRFHVGESIAALRKLSTRRAESYR